MCVASFIIGLFISICLFIHLFSYFFLHSPHKFCDIFCSFVFVFLFAFVLYFLVYLCFVSAYFVTTLIYSSFCFCQKFRFSFVFLNFSKLLYNLSLHALCMCECVYAGVFVLVCGRMYLCMYVIIFLLMLLAL